MTRTQGVDLPNDKRVKTGLTTIYGVDKRSSNKILAKLGINLDTRVKGLTESGLSDARNELDSYPIEGDLRRDVTMNVKRLKKINCYGGSRHKKGLPVRERHTKNSAKVRKGPGKQA